MFQLRLQATRRLGRILHQVSDSSFPCKSCGLSWHFRDGSLYLSSYGRTSKISWCRRYPHSPSFQLPGAIKRFHGQTGQPPDSLVVTSQDDSAAYERAHDVFPSNLMAPGCICVPFLTANCHLDDSGYLAHCQHQSHLLRLEAPFRLEFQNHDRMVVISSQHAPVMLHCTADMLPAVVSAKQRKAWLCIELDGVTAATTVVLHVASATHGIKVLVGEYFSKTGPVAKQLSFRVQVLEQVHAVSAHNGRWRSDFAAVETVFSRYYQLLQLRGYMCFAVTFLFLIVVSLCGCKLV